MNAGLTACDHLELLLVHFRLLSPFKRGYLARIFSLSLDHDASSLFYVFSSDTNDAGNSASR